MSALVSSAPVSDLLGMGIILSTALDMDAHNDSNVSANSSVKRRAASPALDDGAVETPRKRTKLEHDDNCESTGPNSNTNQATVGGQQLAADLAEELECGCCSAIVYRPVIVMPCQHFFCGRYVSSDDQYSNLMLFQLLRTVDKGKPQHRYCALSVLTSLEEWRHALPFVSRIFEYGCTFSTTGEDGRGAGTG
jgi:hypothetical protein